jgi:4-hydroxy-2-oxoheptanedioate aldolase
LCNQKMLEEISEFRSKLRAGAICLGAGITLADSCIVEAIAPSVDFFWIDLEHSHLSYETVHTHLIAARAGGKPGLVRVRGSDTPHIKPILDIGAGGVIVPQVRSAEEVRQVVAACRYPPLGQRGYGPRRASSYGREGGPEWMHHVNEQLFLGVQIENRDALSEVDEIARIEGLDSIVLGPYDLSIALGHAGQIDHPEVLSALRLIIAAAQQTEKFVGTGMAASAKDAFAAIALGVQWIQCGDDYGYMVGRANELMDQIRKGCAKSRA